MAGAAAKRARNSAKFFKLPQGRKGRKAIREIPCAIEKHQIAKRSNPQKSVLSRG